MTPETPETIVLPRSGLVLTRSDNLPVWSCGTKVGMVCIDGNRPVWSAYLGDERSPLEVSYHLDKKRRRSAHPDGRERCIAWLDEKVLAMRAALLDGPGVREAVARALYRDADPIQAEDYPDAFRAYMGHADAVLAALRDGGGK